MSLLRNIASGLRSLFRREQMDEELDEEVRTYLAMAAEEKMKTGMSRKDAVRAARLELGNLEVTKEIVRAARWESLVETWWQDLRHGLRMLRRSPGFTAAVVLTLALGIGANTAIFSIVNAVLLRSLPYRDPDRLVRIFFNEPGVGLRGVRFSKPELDDLLTRAGVCEDVSPIFEGSEDLTGAKQPERLEAVNGSFSYFSMLGVVPQIGRLFGPQDFVPGFATEAVISDGLWRRAYGADPNVLGRTIRIDSDPLTIIGVLPRGFRH